MKIRENINQLFDDIKTRFFSTINFDILKVIYILIFLIIYISNQHSVEKKIREITKIENEVEELRTDYITLNNNYTFSRKETEVIKRVKKMNLTSSEFPPEKITIQK